MKKLIIILLISISSISLFAQNSIKETKEQHDQRMEWWRNARFGMFIHWGLYSIPAGERNGQTDYAEWIRNQAEIPIDEYDKYVKQFNPVKFNADEWVKIAKDAGMKYIVITSKHHDGFCLFNSKYTDFDIMSTPFKRDLLKELSKACKKEGMKLGFYYSIMDWHHIDYLPRRGWENRSSEGADFGRYIKYMKNQLKELLTNYGDISILWFDGEWEKTWSEKFGIDLYKYVRSLRPDIIINNRIDPNREGLEGFSHEGEMIGDFGTPEQQIPSTGLPGMDWESCMTMNDHWGYNKNDKNFKSSKEIIRLLTDIASKGGNYLLNVGPTSKGIFPPESVKILGEVGKWMKTNGESIYGTSASPFMKLEWGRCTQKKIGENTRLYLHIFSWSKDGKLILPGIYSEPIQSYLLADKKKTAHKIESSEDTLVISIPTEQPDKKNSVVVLEVKDKVDVNNPPTISAERNIFIDDISVNVNSDRENVKVRYTTDGCIPTIESPVVDGQIILTATSTLKTRCFRDGKPISRVSEETFTKVEPESAVEVNNLKSGIEYKYYEGKWEKLPDFGSLTAVEEGVQHNFTISPQMSSDYFAFEFTGYINLPVEGVYTFYTVSDDGSKLYINDKLVVNNDGLHGLVQNDGLTALQQGYHKIHVTFFEYTGDENLNVLMKGPGMEKQIIPDNLLSHKD